MHLMAIVGIVVVSLFVLAVVVTAVALSRRAAQLRLTNRRHTFATRPGDAAQGETIRGQVARLPGCTLVQVVNRAREMQTESQLSLFRVTLKYTSPLQEK